MLTADLVYHDKVDDRTRCVADLQRTRDRAEETIGV